MVELADAVPPPFPDSGCEQRLVYVRVLRGDTVVLNWSERLNKSDLPRRLSDIFRTRAERVLFVDAEPAVPFGAFLEIVSMAKAEVQYVAIVTPAMARKKGCWTFVRGKYGSVPVKQDQAGKADRR
jgi:biopolymer transport protein ExbD